MSEVRNFIQRIEDASSAIRESGIDWHSLQAQVSEFREIVLNALENMEMQVCDFEKEL